MEVTMSDTPTTRFAHQRLDAYHVAMDLFRGVEEIAAGLPQGHAELKDQLRRAAGATVRNIAEGANRMHPRDQAARFTLARCECGECEAVLHMAQVLSLAPSARLIALRRLTDRVAAMLWGLIRRLRE
jgi:four helix bundle protein